MGKGTKSFRRHRKTGTDLRVTLKSQLDKANAEIGQLKTILAVLTRKDCKYQEKSTATSCGNPHSEYYCGSCYRDCEQQEDDNETVMGKRSR